MSLNYSKNLPVIRKQVIVRYVSLFTGFWAFAIGINYFHHQSYWRGTLPRVQTVDFNILSHILPIKLSYALLSNNKEEIQKTLDSNYGYFGLVVTDCLTTKVVCENENIIYYSQGRNNYKNIFENLNKSSLEFDYLKDPPPLFAEKKYLDSRNVRRVSTGRHNEGKILGRVYYLYGTPPRFIDKYQEWLTEAFKDSSANRLFLMTHICSTAVSLFIFVTIEILFLKNKNRLLIEQQEKQVIKEHNELLENEIGRIRLKIQSIRDYYSGFEACIDQEISSTVSNYLQELKEICYRLNVDIANIDHDFKKPPLLYCESTGEREIIAQAIQNINPSLSTKEVNVIREYLADIDETIQFIEWILDDLKEIANLDPTRVEVDDVIQTFMSNVPPNVANKKWIKLENTGEFNMKPIISANAWHLKSIIKNIIYNSTKELVFYRIKKGADFVGKITILPYEDSQRVGFTILDNGPGIQNSDLLKSLYRKDFESKESFNAKSGRGSSIVHSYLALHEGNVQVENAIPNGLKVTCSFPRFAEA